MEVFTGEDLRIVEIHDTQLSYFLQSYFCPNAVQYRYNPNDRMLFVHTQSTPSGSSLQRQLLIETH